MDKQYNINKGDVYNLHESALSVANYGIININVFNVSQHIYTVDDIPVLEHKLKLAARNMDFETAARYKNIMMELVEEER